MSNCEGLQAQLNSFLDGELDAAHSVSLSAHLEECPDCRRELAALRSTQAILRAAPVPDGKQAQQFALATFRNSLAAERSVPQRRPLWQGALASASAVALLAWGVHSLTRKPGQASAQPESRQMVATTIGTEGLPTADELDEMTSLHAARSFAISPGDDGVQQTTLADANSRLSLRSR